MDRLETWEIPLTSNVRVNRQFGSPVDAGRPDLSTVFSAAAALAFQQSSGHPPIPSPFAGGTRRDFMPLLGK
jgi:hypothetical protein